MNLKERAMFGLVSFLVAILCLFITATITDYAPFFEILKNKNQIGLLFVGILGFTILCGGELAIPKNKEQVEKLK